MCYYRTCPICSANLDPGEHCDCHKHKPTDEDDQEAPEVDEKPVKEAV